MLTDEPFDRYPADGQIAEILAEHGVDAELAECKFWFCRGDVLLATAHRHTGSWVGDTCCWDERLRSSE
ncbi:hypothetical protein [Streptomyces sp. NPDC007083]|uniref:hypothetical protein n=1 Tax=Streptomyces sp. NPDC007083 TaxID=3156913 RepID=UPI0033C8B31E